MPPAPRRPRPQDPEYFRRALEDYHAAHAAWRAAYAALSEAPPGSRAASVTLESARHELRMAKGRLDLEEALLANRPPQRSWASH